MIRINNGEEIRAQGEAIYRKGLRKHNGKLILTSQRLVFIPLNKRRKQVGKAKIIDLRKGALFFEKSHFYKGKGSLIVDEQDGEQLIFNIKEPHRWEQELQNM
ncbi:hypothetical protein D3C77_279510 [compost metagenome]